jgi:hypothetical protein|tara:strand:+ start:132 stop:275 length:144 start_codon:yes stop_codon:yes gene_type:complete
VGDYVLHPVINDPNPATLNEIERLSELGVRTVKVFLTAFDPHGGQLE